MSMLGIRLPVRVNSLYTRERLPRSSDFLKYKCVAKISEDRHCRAASETSLTWIQLRLSGIVVPIDIFHARRTSKDTR